jgi:hypothetical protein
LSELFLSIPSSISFLLTTANAKHQPTTTERGVCATMAKPCAVSRAELWVCCM